EKWRFRQAYGGVAVVDEENLITGQREFVSSARTDAVDGREELEARLLAGIFNGKPCLVGELAKGHLPGMGRSAQHEDVGAGAENALLQAGYDDDMNLGMLEAHALDRVRKLDVNSEIVRVQLQPVVVGDATVFLNVHGEGGDGSVETEFPVTVPIR